MKGRLCSFIVALPLWALLAVLAFGGMDRFQMEARGIQDWSALPGYQNTQAMQGKLAAAVPALQQSCTKVLSRDDKTAQLQPGQPLFGTVEQWQQICQQVTSAPSPAAAAAFLYRALRPVELRDNRPDGRPQGLFTGYYEPELAGSLKRHGPYQTPLYEKPADLVTADLGQFDPDLSGKKVAGRVTPQQQLVAYHDRAAIDAGALGQNAKPLVWVKDPVAAFMLQVQGSGRVRLPNGQVLQVGYAASNGRPYTAIGRYMVAQGILPQEGVSMPAIRAWLQANPDQLQQVLEQNQSYIFFQLKPGGPYGTQNVPLTPWHSLAVDTQYIPLGVPVYVDTTLTTTADPTATFILVRPFQQVMVAQDTGGAIKGPVRGDIFFGAGSTAAAQAGHQQAAGRIFVLVPRPESKRAKE